jgi:TRAP-type uncharacterized transport system substrate-binding protein
VALVALGGFLVARSWKPRMLTLEMLTDIMPNQALMAQEIAQDAPRHGLKVALSHRPVGALEAMDEVDQPDGIDVALVASGFTRREYPDLRQVTALTTLPMHLFVRPELAPGGLSALKGKRIQVGPGSSADHALALDLLAFAGFRVPRQGVGGDFVADLATPAELERTIAALGSLSGADRDHAIAKLPDAVFLLSPLPSILAKDLVASAGYRLVPLPFAEAYCLDRLNPTAASEVEVDRAHFAAVDIPPYSYGIDPATRLILVAHDSTPPEAISRLLVTIFDGPAARLLDPVPLRDQVPQFPLHAGTELYMKRNDSVLTSELLSTFTKLSGAFGAAASGVVAFYGFLRIRQLRRFEAYYHEIRKIELIARGQEFDPQAPADPPALREYLEGRLLDLKSHALKDFAEGGLKGEGLMSGIVSLVNDTRASLERLPARGGEESRPLST